MDWFYKSKCVSGSEYDKVIDFIIKNNVAGPKAWGESPEEFAKKAVHDCIRTVVFGESMYASTGMCLAVRASSNVESPDYKRVILAVSL